MKRLYFIYGQNHDLPMDKQYLTLDLISRSEKFRSPSWNYRMEH